MQTAFITNVPIKMNADITALLQSAPGCISVECLKDKISGHESGVIFCRLYDGTFHEFQSFLKNQSHWKHSIIIQEGVKLEE